MADNPVTPNSSNWTPQASESSNWTPQAIGSSNWNKQDSFGSVGKVLLSNNSSVLLSDKSSHMLRP